MLSEVAVRYDFILNLGEVIVLIIDDSTILYVVDIV